MSLRINTNIMAMNTHRNMQMTDVLLSKSMEKLSSGLRVNRASDDAAGLSISENLRAQIRGLAQAERNAQDGISLINTAEGALNEIHSILQRLRELTVQASNGTLTDENRESIQIEVNELVREIHNISRNTSFNGMGLLDGTFDPAYGGTALTFQVGANNGQTLSIDIRNIDVSRNTATSWWIAHDTDSDGEFDLFADVDDQQNAMSWLDSASFGWDAMIEEVSQMRSALGAVSNRLEHTINNLAISRENLAAAESRIRDVDMADEMSKFTRSQILMQSGTAMLAQANAQPQSVLGLLG
ncbi:MAG: flagellin [Candidatus Sericytochromatia bacterium]